MSTPPPERPSEPREGARVLITPEVPSSPASDHDVPFVGYQVRLTHGGEELAVLPALGRPGEPVSLMALDVLMALGFEVQELAPGTPTVGQYDGAELAAELTARALVHQEKARREERR